MDLNKKTYITTNISIEGFFALLFERAAKLTMTKINLFTDINTTI